MADRLGLIGIIYFNKNMLKNKNKDLEKIGTNLIKSGDDLYDVYLLVDGAFRSENRRTMDVAPEEVEDEEFDFESLLDAVGGTSPASMLKKINYFRKKLFFISFQIFTLYAPKLLIFNCFLF